MAWEFISIENVDLLQPAREQLHQAAQIVGAVGRTYHPKVKDDHYGSFTWDAERKMLKGSLVEGNENFHAALEVSSLNLHLLSEDNSTLSSFSLDEKTQKQALLWLEGELVQLGLNGTQLNLQLPYEIPVYPTSKGKEFKLDNVDAFQVLSHYFSNTHFLLERITRNEANASEISCWPHHFDIATLITLNDTGNPETSTSIGVGMSPGDSQYNEPYFYLAPWPYPKIDGLPAMIGPGEWHTEGWVGGVLTASQLQSGSGLNNQMQTVQEFLQNGLSVLKTLLDP